MMKDKHHISKYRSGFCFKINTNQVCRRPASCKVLWFYLIHIYPYQPLMAGLIWTLIIKLSKADDKIDKEVIFIFSVSYAFFFSFCLLNWINQARIINKSKYKCVWTERKVFIREKIPFDQLHHSIWWQHKLPQCKLDPL